MQMSESEIVLDFMADKSVDKSDFIVDVNNLRAIAGMHESLAWFSGACLPVYS